MLSRCIRQKLCCFEEVYKALGIDVRVNDTQAQCTLKRSAIDAILSYGFIIG